LQAAKFNNRVADAPSRGEKNQPSIPTDLGSKNNVNYEIKCGKIAKLLMIPGATV